MSDTRPTPETDAAIADGHTFNHEDLRLVIAFCQRLERERDEARNDVFLASGELLVPMPEPGTDMARVMVANAVMRGERDKALRELQEARNTIVNVRKERGARVMELKKELQEARAALSGRTVSCSQCNESAKQIESMREAIKGAHNDIKALSENYDLTAFGLRDIAKSVIVKLKPFLP